jgi:hypothetical protein
MHDFLENVAEIKLITIAFTDVFVHSIRIVSQLDWTDLFAVEILHQKNRIKYGCNSCDKKTVRVAAAES